MTKTTFLGGCRQVGASAVLIEQAGTRVVMDYGTAFNGTQRVPLPISTRNLVSVLSHAHLDHSGSLPLIAGSQTHKVPMYSTTLTKELTQLLLMDMLRIGGETLAFERPEIQALLRNTNTLSYGEPVQIHPKIKLTLYDAGHIPGSASILVETEANGGPAVRILYTGDLNTTNTRLVNGAPSLRALGDLDAIIVESTYAQEEHPTRRNVETEFVETARSSLESGGTVLIPSFAVGRAQEILAVLYQHRHRGLDFPIFIDGMARKVTRIMQQHSHSFTGGSLVSKAAKQSVFIRNRADRKVALDEPAVIIAPAGMLKGGTAQLYLRNIASDSRSSVLLVGKQLPGTPGAELLDTGKIQLSDKGQAPETFQVKGKVRSFDFSCHVGRQEVLNYLKQAKGNPTILTMHGEPASCENLAHTLRMQFGFKAKAATCGETIRFN
ncbi:MAG: MBL fold metallo-hydrolase [Promethearchaeota archaeon]